MIAIQNVLISFYEKTFIMAEFYLVKSLTQLYVYLKLLVDYFRLSMSFFD